MGHEFEMQHGKQGHERSWSEERGKLYENSIHMWNSPQTF